MKQPNYEEAIAQLEAIVTRLERDELDIDQMADQLKTAQRLIKLCKDKLAKADADIRKALDADEG